MRHPREYTPPVFLSPGLPVSRAWVGAGMMPFDHLELVRCVVDVPGHTPVVVFRSGLRMPRTNSMGTVVLFGPESPVGYHWPVVSA